MGRSRSTRLSRLNSNNEELDSGASQERKGSNDDRDELYHRDQIIVAHDADTVFELEFWGRKGYFKSLSCYPASFTVTKYRIVLNLSESRKGVIRPQSGIEIDKPLRRPIS